MQIYGSKSNGQLEPSDLAKCMIDTYRGMNKHFIPTGYELSSFARVFDQSRKGKITHPLFKQGIVSENLSLVSTQQLLTGGVILKYSTKKD